MKNLFVINESERERILGMHQGATKKQYLKESDEQDLEEQDLGRVATYALVGGLAGGAYALVSGAGGSYDGVKKIFQACSTKGMGKSTMDGSTLDSIADQVFDALDGMGTDEDGLKKALSQIQTVPDLCAVKKRYAENHPGSDMFNDLDGDIDSDSEWNMYVYRPLIAAVRKSKEIAAQAEAQAKEQGSKVGKTGTRVGAASAGTALGKAGASKKTSSGGGTGVNYGSRIKSIQKQAGAAETGTMDSATITAIMKKLSPEKINQTSSSASGAEQV